MKHKKNYSSDDRKYGYEEYYHNPKRELLKESGPKRKINNWTKVYETHSDEYDELEEFHTPR